ncbi:MAG: peptidylprolyl isomerase [Phycisphaerae bacterium]
MRTDRVFLALAFLLPLTNLNVPLAAAQDSDPLSMLRAKLVPKSYIVPVGSPVWVRFAIENDGDEPVSLTVPGTEPDLPLPEVGLPISHIFSGQDAGAVAVTTNTNQRWEKPISYRRPTQAPILIIGPRSSVGTLVDLRDYYPSLRSAGEYRVNWAPYGGKTISESVLITVTPLKQAEIHTDEGIMTVEFFYEDAPKTVANFIDLAGDRFYDGKTFHRLDPGYFLQGGCPKGNGTGIRLDGKRVPAEFNAQIHEKGTLSMALADDDPDSASCQFFICNTRQKDWDGRYTVFGRIVGDDSLEVLDRLMQTEVDDYSRPRKTLYMRSIRIIDAPYDGSNVR